MEKWQRQMINLVKPINFLNHKKEIEDAFKEICEPLNDYEEIKIVENSLAIELNINNSIFIYNFIVTPTSISLFNGNILIGVYTIDPFYKGFYDWGVEQSKHNSINEDFKYEDVLNELLNRAFL